MPVAPPAVQPVFTCRSVSWQQSLPALLEATGLRDRLLSAPRILIKPNLVEALVPPITTPVALIAALVDYVRGCAPTTAEIIVGEGSGARAYDTQHCFQALGYEEMAAGKNISLVDLNLEPLVRKSQKNCHRWPVMHLPRLVFESFLISVPVLKAHTLAEVTLTMKNMMGLAPPAHFQKGGHWKKAAFHDRIQEAIFDLNRYRTPDFTVLDATVGMPEAHLWGPTCNPPVNRLAAGFDPVAMDAYGAMLLKRDWRRIEHIRLAHGCLGLAEPLVLREV
ncbi:MAG: hypothetical protein A2521_13375 [Deltaproteobacteria bacterium RIFOXYD12_FULL_57_12]|nr:MAG: hypothetical protein A2521_13375 [Deltaproteobacteria bacterium RIFOXYD12_FULL_57_12]